MSAVPSPGERLGVAAAAAGFLYLVFFRAGTFIFPFPSGSNGVFFDAAHRVLAGEVMYRDFFEFVGPGTVYLNTLALLIGGPRIAAFGYLGVMLGAALAVLMHHLSASLLPGRWRLLPPCALVVLVYAPYTFGDHKWPALCLGLLALVFLGRASVAPPRAAAAGALLGGSILFTQDLGAGLAAGALAWLVLSRAPRRIVAAFALGLFAPLALVVGFFAWKAGLRAFLYDWLLFPLTHYRELNRFRLAAGSASRTWPRDVAQVTLAACGVVGAVAHLRQGSGEAPPSARLLALSGLGMLLATVHRGLYPAGLAVQTAVLIPLAVRMLVAPGRATSRAAAAPRAALLAVIAVGILHGAAGFVLWRQWLQPMVRESHRAGDVWTARPMPELAWIEARVAAGQPAFLMPARGGHYFLTQTRDVTSYPYLIEGQHTVEQARRALAQVEAARPAAGLWDQRPWPRSDPDSAGPLDLLWEGLRRQYDVERLPSGVYLMQRKQP